MGHKNSRGVRPVRSGDGAREPRGLQEHRQAPLEVIDRRCDTVDTTDGDPIALGSLTFFCHTDDPS